MSAGATFDLFAGLGGLHDDAVRPCVIWALTASSSVSPTIKLDPGSEAGVTISSVEKWPHKNGP